MTGRDPSAELRRAEAEIAWLTAFIEERPDGSEGARRMLQAEREHAERVRALMRACGARP